MYSCVYYCLLFICHWERDVYTSQSEEEGTSVNPFALYTPWKSDTLDWSKTRMLAHTLLLTRHFTTLTQPSSPLGSFPFTICSQVQWAFCFLISGCKETGLLKLPSATEHVRQVCGLAAGEAHGHGVYFKNTAFSSASGEHAGLKIQSQCGRMGLPHTA